MKLWQAILFGLSTSIVSSAFTTMLHSQERSARPTRHWEAAGFSYNDWTSARVDVVDMEGVCLYVVARSGDPIAVTAVPKTQLPKGTGCQ